jgi:hypothetical protein
VCAQQFGPPISYNVNTNAGHFLTFLLLQPNVTNGTVRFLGGDVSYKLRISPAPVTARFTDVPTTHPFFQYIEALAASGVTAGCTATQYCPDAPLTRGQMAVFLSRALGLHFPN